jgi:predicted Zn finger-like uncharacterized protein
MKCPTCKSQLETIKGLGDSHIETICPNFECPSHYPHELCPNCKSSEKSNVEVLGLGNQEFTCKKCKHLWTSI